MCQLALNRFFGIREAKFLRVYGVRDKAQSKALSVARDDSAVAASHKIAATRTNGLSRDDRKGAS